MILGKLEVELRRPLGGGQVPARCDSSAKCQPTEFNECNIAATGASTTDSKSDTEEKQQARAEGQQAAIAVLHHQLPATAIAYFEVQE
jgi:hypothetical protein